MKQVVVLIFALLLSYNLQALPRDKHLTNDGKLGETLILKDGQSGFVGITGSIWTIDPDGSWEHKRFFNNRIDKADRQGELTAKKLQVLADVLAHAQMDKMPARVGEFGGTNPHVVILSWGKDQCVWTLPPGSPEPKHPASPFCKLTSQESFAEIYQAVFKALKTPKDK